MNFNLIVYIQFWFKVQDYGFFGDIKIKTEKMVSWLTFKDYISALISDIYYASDDSEHNMLNLTEV